MRDLLVCPHLLQETEPLDDPVVEVNEFCLGQPFNLDRHNPSPFAICEHGSL